VKAFFTVLLAATALLAGCVGPQTQLPGAGRCVVKKKTPFYKHGPAQAIGPDFSLDPNVNLTVIRRETGYSQVMLDNGQSGYVATEALAPVEVKPLADATPAPAKKSKPSVTRRREYDFMPPQLTEPPMPLPEPEPQQPAPPFRY
jgi:hypothetical protein